MCPIFCRPFFSLLLACVAFACVKPPLPLPALGAREGDAFLALQLWEKEAMRFVHAQNAWLWQHWSVGAPLEVASLYAPFEAFFSEQTWREMQNLPTPPSPAQACALQNLQALVLGELLAGKLRKHNHAVALVEDSLTVMYQAKDFPWYELGRLLAHEKTALHRQNLWLYSLKKARPLEAALQAKEKKTAQALEHLGVDEARATQLFRGVALEALSLPLQTRLEETHSSWCAHVEAMAAQHKGVPKATRADLPFFFQAKLPGSHLHFPAKQQAAVVDAVFERLGLWPTPRLVRHIGETQAALPLPLALNGGLEASWLSFTPVAGPHSLRHLLGEMGRTLAWAYVAPNQWACRHLGPPILSQASALVFAQLAQEEAWWEEQALPESLAKAWARAFAAQAEFEFRKMAAHFLAQWATRALGEEEAWGTYVSIQAEVLCVQPLEAEAARLYVDREAFFAMADMLRAQLLAERMGETLRARFGQRWWNVPEAGVWLKALWQEGNAVREASSTLPSWPQTLPPL